MSRRNGMNIEYYDCTCMDPEHVLRFAYCPDDEFEEVCIEIHLASRQWYVRLWQAIKHVFGYKSRYGNFGSWVLDPEDTQRLLKMLQDLKMRQMALETVEPRLMGAVRAPSMPLRPEKGNKEDVPQP